ncbi:MAG: PIG-L deacetylase family protein, partial [Candidatus Kryptoniota bacterium]
MTTALVFSPHADDAAAFCGATLAKLAYQGWNIVMVRVTDDCRDSVGLNEAETRQRITEELHEAASILGISEIIELGYETDQLSAVSELELREKFVYLIRKYRPYAVFSFDPDGLLENNQDHKRVAEAVDEALWVAAFDKHYPQHFKEGLAPYSVVERWYFARKHVEPNRAEDISEFLEKKIEALCLHQTQIKHMLHQYQMQLEAWGKRVSWVDESYKGDHREIVATFLQEQANAVAREFSLGEGRMGELFRYVRFGDLEGLFQMMAEPLDQSIQSIDQLESMMSGEAHPLDSYLNYILPTNLNQRIRIMGHHHLCAGAFEELFSSTPFRLSYRNLVEELKPNPN